MSISVDNSNSQVDFKALFEQALKSSDLEGAESGSSVILNGDSVTVSVRDPSSGETVTQTVPANEAGLLAVMEGGVQALYAGAVTADEMADMLGEFLTQCGYTPPAQGTPAPSIPKMTLAELGQALQDEANASNVESEAVTGRTLLSGSSAAETTFFDIYALMALLQQVGQQERNAARNLKMAELSTEVASIETQANKQRESGVVGAIVSGISAGVQLVMSCVSAVKSVNSIKSGYNTNAAQNAALDEGKANTLQAAGQGKETSQAYLDKLREQTPSAAQQKVTDAMDKAGVPKAKAEYETALAKQSELENAGPSDSAEVKDLKAKLNDTNLELATEYDKPAADQNQEKIGRLESQAKDYEAQLDAAKSKPAADSPELAQAKKDTEAAKQNYMKALDSAKTEIDTSYTQASGDTALAENGSIQAPSKDASQKTIACQQKQKTAASASKLMDAEVVNAKAQMGDLPDAGQISSARAKATESNTALPKDPAFSRAQNHPWNPLIQSLPNMVGQLGQSLSTMASQIVAAEGTEEQANQKTAEMYRDESNSLFTQAQELIASARECFKAIIQAESQSIEQIIRA